MGDCIYCQKPAGFLRKMHKECHKIHEKSKSEIKGLVEKFGFESCDFHSLKRKIDDVSASGWVDQTTKQSLIIDGWVKAVSIAFDDGILSVKEESSLFELAEHFSLSQNLLDQNGAYTKVIKGAILREVLEGELPERVRIDGNLPFNLQKSEKLVWVFQGVDYYEEKTKSHYVGGSKGMSVRVAKGIYLRAGSFKGERVSTSETLHMDTGLLGVTNKHLYFAGSSKRFRINYNKIVTIEPYSDGVGVQRDAQTAKPQTFVTDDGWFTYNLIANLSQM